MTYKKVMLATVASAAVLASVSAAQAVEVKIEGSWEGGLMVNSFGDNAGTTLNDGTTTDSSNQPGRDHRSANFFQESDLEFITSNETDAGWRVSAHISMSGETSASYQIYETFVRFSHDTYGMVELGNRDVAGYRMVPFAASAGFQPNGGAGNRVEKGMPDSISWAPSAAGGGPGGAGNLLTEEDTGLPTATSGAGTSDSTKLSYITPRIYGFQLGLSYAPDACETGISGNLPTACGNSGGFERNDDEAFTAAGIGDAWSIGANQALPLKMLGLGDDGLIVVGGSYSQSKVETVTLLYGNNSSDAGYLVMGDVKETTAGALFRRKGFQLSGGYKHVDWGEAMPEVETWQIGATQKFGAWQFGVNYAYGEADRPSQQEVLDASNAYTGTVKALGGTELNTATRAFIIGSALTGVGYGGTDTLQTWEVATNYDMGAGVKLIGAVRHYDAEHGAGAAAGEFDGFIFEAGTKITF